MPPEWQGMLAFAQVLGPLGLTFMVLVAIQRGSYVSGRESKRVEESLRELLKEEREDHARTRVERDRLFQIALEGTSTAVTATRVLVEQPPERRVARLSELESAR